MISAFSSRGPAIGAPGIKMKSEYPGAGDHRVTISLSRNTEPVHCIDIHLKYVYTPSRLELVCSYKSFKFDPERSRRSDTMNTALSLQVGVADIQEGFSPVTSSQSPSLPISGQTGPRKVAEKGTMTCAGFYVWRTAFSSRES